MQKRLLGMLIVCMVLVVIGGCKTKDAFTENSINTLMTTKATWEDVQTAVAKAKIAGFVTDAQWRKFVDLDKKFRATQNAAVELLKVYSETQQGKDAITASLNNLLGILVEGQTLLASFQQ